MNEEFVCPVNQFATQDIGGDHTDEVEEEEEPDDSQAGDGNVALEKIDRDLGHEWVEDAVQSVEDELQNEESDPERQDHQDPRENLSSKVFENCLDHALATCN
jgi:hypothetical protein